MGSVCRISLIIYTLITQRSTFPTYCFPLHSSYLLSCLLPCMCVSFVYCPKSFPPAKKNPYYIVCQVTKFICRNQMSAPTRSAFTYWENRSPSRFSLGQKKYGGPFDDQEPEDVKTFWSIVGVFLSYFGFLLSYATINNMFYYLNPYQGSTTELGGYAALILWKIFDQQVFDVVPVMELFIIPFFPKVEYFFSTPTKGLLLAYFLALAGLVGILAIDIIGHYLTPEPIGCYFTSTVVEEVHLSVFYFAIPLLFWGAADYIYQISIFEFICSQGPGNMKGMLCAVFWSLQSVLVLTQSSVSYSPVGLLSFFLVVFGYCCSTLSCVYLV